MIRLIGRIRPILPLGPRGSARLGLPKNAGTARSAKASGLSGAHSMEFDESTPHPVIDLMLEQRGITDLGGTMRLGAYPARLAAGSLVRRIYGGLETVDERHRHRFEVNNVYRDQLADAGLRWSGTSPDGGLVEFVELPDHPFFVATQAHPELRSRPNRPHPLFAGLIGAAVQHRREASGRLPVELGEPSEADLALARGGSSPGHPA
jgi:CTP synthase